MYLNHSRAIRWSRFCCKCGAMGDPRGLDLLKKEISLNIIVGPTNQNMWVPPDVGPTRISHKSTWVPPKHIVGPAWTIYVVCGWFEPSMRNPTAHLFFDDVAQRGDTNLPHFRSFKERLFTRHISPHLLMQILFSTFFTIPTLFIRDKIWRTRHHLRGNWKMLIATSYHSKGHYWNMIFYTKFFNKTSGKKYD
jgi:hypothetical protein